MNITLKDGEHLQIVTPLGKISLHVRNSEKVVITDERPETYRSEKIPLDAILTKSGWVLR